MVWALAQLMHWLPWGNLLLVAAIGSLFASTVQSGLAVQAHIAKPGSANGPTKGATGEATPERSD